MTANVSQISLEKPLRGAIICCTSIPPEKRIQLADFAQQMGAEHKLDLTSDVTHLLVGDTDTPKYQYVAREREDVKVLRPEFVEAIREYWMADQPLDLNLLEAKYRLPTLAGSKICITGFDDLSFRAQLQTNIIQQGGEYTGDLTKDVTHLIAAQPIGKKYEYANQWNIKIVSLRWYKDTLERGMQLDEKLYHPTIPVEEQGIGAWNRHRDKPTNLGKRFRDGTPTQEPARKLRRTASAKLGSQSEHMWNTIVNGPIITDQAHRSDALRPSKSTPTLRPEQSLVINDCGASKASSLLTRNSTENSDVKTGFLNLSHFVIDGFDQRKKLLICKTVLGHGGIIHDSLQDLTNQRYDSGHQLLLLVPYQTSREGLQISSPKVAVVTELWLEWCMQQKAKVSSHQYPLGQLAMKKDLPQIQSISINATGFPGVQTLHIAKQVSHTGARYEETFTSKTSILVCSNSNTNRQKLAHAEQWGVVAVSENWLWSFLSSEGLPSFEEYALRNPSFVSAKVKEYNPEQRPNLQGCEEHTKMSKPLAWEKSDGGRSKSTDLAVEGEGFHTQSTAPIPPRGSAKSSATLTSQSLGTNALSSHQQETIGGPIPIKMPLHEVSCNSPGKANDQVRAGEKKRLFQTYDGSSSARTDENIGQAVKYGEEHTRSVQNQPGLKTGRLDSIDKQFQELRDLQAQSKAQAQKLPTSHNEPKRKGLLGRALSNLSNSSRNSNRQSRASSIDSMNTDGLGVELSNIRTQSQPEDDSTAKTSVGGVGLIGRAKSKSTINPTTTAQQDPKLISTAINLNDPNLCRDEYAEAEVGPQLTQLGYEDSEEAIIFREKLAAKRRARGQPARQDDGSKPIMTRKERDQERQKRVIRDDDALVSTGWAGGRRTRQKDREMEEYAL